MGQTANMLNKARSELTAVIKQVTELKRLVDEARDNNMIGNVLHERRLKYVEKVEEMRHLEGVVRRLEWNIVDEKK